MLVFRMIIKKSLCRVILIQNSPMASIDDFKVRNINLNSVKDITLEKY